MIHEIALGELTRRQIAAKYNRTQQYINLVAMENSAEIAELQAMAEEKRRELWVMDPYNRALERMTDIEDLNEEIEHVKAARSEFAEQMGRQSEPINDLYLKLMDLKHKLMRHLEESSGQLPTRAAPQPERGRASYEIPGVDLGEVVKGWSESPSEVLK